MKFHVVDVEAPEVLSAQTCKDMGLLAKINSLQQHSIQKSQTDMGQGIFYKYPDLFQVLKCLLGEHSIKLDQALLR